MRTVLANFDFDGVLRVVVGNTVDGIELVLHVEVHIEPVHDHDHLGRR